MISWLDVNTMRRRFARAASDRERYQRATWLQREIGGRMVERLEYMKLEPKVVVDAGSGSGHALTRLAERFPQARLLAVDATVPLLQPLAPIRSPVEWLRRFIAAPRVHPVAADYARLPLADASVGCVWSNLALQWSDDPSQAFVEWHRVLETGGLVLFASLGPDTLKELRSAWSIADRSFSANGQPQPVATQPTTLQPTAPQSRTSPKPPSRVHPFLDMHDLGDMLVHAGFADPVMDVETLTLTYRGVDALVDDLRGAGAAGSHTDRPRGLTGKAHWQAMRDRYETLRRDDGQLPVTFEIVYGHAWKPEPRARIDADGVARFRVEDIGGLGRRPTQRRTSGPTPMSNPL